jgi:hypothetical protein
VDSRYHGRARSGVTLRLVPPADRPGAPGPPADRPAAPGAPARELRDARLHKRFPAWHVLALNGLTVAQYSAGCAAVLLAYRRYPIVGLPLGLAYLVFAVVQFYVLMPLVVCPGCVYRAVRDGRCPTSLNLISARLCRPSATATAFRERTHGALCQSRLNLASWVAPLPLALPGLALFFSWTAATLTLVVVGLVVVRIWVVRSAVCPHCLARRWCPNAEASIS